MTQEELTRKIGEIRNTTDKHGYDGYHIVLADVLEVLASQQGSVDLSNLPEDQRALLRGDHGYSAYEIWLSLGNEGTEQDFINSLKGERGERGNDGLDGIGVNGRDGQSYHITKADSEEEAIALSIGNPQHIIYWT